MIKYAQLFPPGAQGATVADLLQAVQGDPNLSPADKQQIISAVVQSLGGSGASTPLSILATRGAGGIIGYLISRYFGMGPMGTAISTLAGIGGSRMFGGGGQAPNPFPGWKVM